jgi:hypothetical protein
VANLSNALAANREGRSMISNKCLLSLICPALKARIYARVGATTRQMITRLVQQPVVSKETNHVQNT